MLSTLRITGNNNALRRMKKGKAVGADELPVEVWKCKGKMGIRFLTRLFNRLLLGERMPEEWRRSVLIPIYKNKGDAQCCGNYRGIKLMNHTMKVWERIIEARLRAGLRSRMIKIRLRLRLPTLTLTTNPTPTPTPTPDSDSYSDSLVWAKYLS